MITLGLDQYLSVKNYVNKNNGWGEDAVRRPEYDAIVKAAGLGKFTTDPSVSIYGANVGVTAAYWRKANHIHKWFVANVQNGEDECREHYVGIDKLKELVAVCADVLLHKDDKGYCEDVLPTGSGFFFGSTEYDEWYFAEVEYTHKRLTEIVNLLEEAVKNDEWFDVTYQSSW